jgi:ATP-dependent Zn protease
VHEAGHAIAVKLISTTHKVDKTIIPSEWREDTFFNLMMINGIIQNHRYRNIVIALAGRAAEEIALAKLMQVHIMTSNMKCGKRYDNQIWNSENLENMIFVSEMISFHRKKFWAH